MGSDGSLIGMRTFFRFGMLWVGLGGVLAFGQGAPGAAPATTVVLPPAPLLPQHVWGLNAGNIVVENAGAPEPLGQFWCEALKGAAETLAASCAGAGKEDGLRRLEVGEYTDPRRKVEIWAFEFEDATDAFSAYTLFRTTMHGVRVSGAEARLRKAGNEMSVDADGTLVWAGTAVMRIVNGKGGAASTEEIIALTAGLPKEAGRRGVVPLLPSEIPVNGLDIASVRYAVGPAGYSAMGGVLPVDILGWDKSAEVAIANYRGKGTLTLLQYPTPQIAGERGRAIQDAVNAEQGKYGAGSPKYGTVAMRRVGPLVGVTTGAWTVAQAKAMLAEVHLNEDLTFDKKLPLEFHAEIRKTATLLENIAIFSGILIVSAILLGLFLGGARAGIRKLQGKPAHSEPEFLTISLRESETEHFAKIHSEGEASEDSEKRTTEHAE
jgi:hypothetical protein